MRSKIFCDAKKQCECMTGVCWDITERRHTEDDLAKKRYLFNALMDNLPDTIYFKDLDCRFTKINRAQAKQLGLVKPEDAIGQTDFEFFDEQTARFTYDDERRIMTTGIPMLEKVEQLRDSDG